MRTTRCERGQVLPLMALVLVVLLGISAFAVDIGYAYYAKRQLQSTADAAALAGAQDLPSIPTAIATATDYVGYNTPANLSGSFTFTYQTQMHRAGHCRRRVRRDGSERPHGDGHRKHEYLVREDVRHRPFQRLDACECLQPVLVHAGGHRDRPGSHGLDVPRSEREHELRRHEQRQARHPDDAGGTQPGVRERGDGGVPTGQDDGLDRGLQCALRHCRRAGPQLRWLRRIHAWVPDRRAGQLVPALNRQDRHDLGPRQAHRLRLDTVGRMCAGGRQHLLQRGAAAGTGRARQARTRERARLHRLLHRRRGKSGQRLPEDLRGLPDPNFPPGGADDQRPCASGRPRPTRSRPRVRRSTPSVTRSGTSRARPGNGLDVYVAATSDVWNSSHTRIVTQGVAARNATTRARPQAEPLALPRAGQHARSACDHLSEALLDIASPKKFYDKTAPGDVPRSSQRSRPTSARVPQPARRRRLLSGGVLA